jgi:hypothetical protein
MGLYPVSRSVVLSRAGFFIYEQQQAARMYKSVFYRGRWFYSCRAFIRTGGIGNGVTVAGVSTSLIAGGRLFYGPSAM